MESSKKHIVKVQKGKQQVQEDQRATKIIDWEDYEQELARLCSLTSALEQSKNKKLLIEEKLNSLIQVQAKSLSRSNELDQMREKLESRKLMMGNMSMHSKVVKEKVRKQEEQLSAEIGSLVVGGSSLSVANKRLQDSSKSLGGENGYAHLKRLQKILRLRQQYMVSQVSLLYPVKAVIARAPEQELESFSSTIKSVANSGVPTGLKLVDQGTLTILGLHLTAIPSTKLSLFPDKKEVRQSSTALGYVAHAVSLIASYLQVPLRYPLRLGGSRSYIHDYAPSVEHSTLDSMISTSSKPVEFPLFIEGQDSTRAAYAVFLLNKDLEQLLNFIGLKSLGPRQILANLKELLRTILSPEYIHTF